MRGRPCAVCMSKHQKKIDADLMAGGAVIPVGAKYGISKSAIARHRVNCLHPQVAAAARLTQGGAASKAPVKRAKAIATGEAPTAAEALSLNGLLERMERSLARLEKSADVAAADNLHTALAAVSGQISRGVEVAGKLQGIGFKEPVPAQLGGGFSISIVIPPIAARPPVMVDVTPEPEQAALPHLFEDQDPEQD